MPQFLHIFGQDLIATATALRGDNKKKLTSPKVIGQNIFPLHALLLNCAGCRQLADFVNDPPTMVKLTVDLIGRTARKKEEGLSQYLKKLTHLYYSEKNIDEIVSIMSSC